MSAPSPGIGFTAWRSILLGLACVLVAGAAGGAHQALAPGADVLAMLAAVALVAAWGLAVRFLLLDTWGPRFWFVTVVAAALLPLLLGTGGVVAGTAVSGFFLAVRRYQPWRHVGDRRRAAGFGLGLVAVALLLVAWGFREGEAPGGLARRLRDLGTWSQLSLLMFWLWSLFHLAMGMRLHFLRLRPKLAVSAFLIGFVPLALVALLGLMVLYTGLGGARAARALAILESWRSAAAAGAEPAPAPFDTLFAWPEPATAPAGAVAMPAPDWTPRLRAAVAGEFAAGDSVAAPVDTTTWFLAGGRVWLMRWQDAGGSAPRVRAWLLGSRALESLSRTLRAGVALGSAGEGDDGEGAAVAADDSLRAPYAGQRAVYRDVADDPSFWNDVRYFGGTLLTVQRPRGIGLVPTGLFMNLKVGWPDLRAEFLEGDNNVNVAVVIALGLVAFTFLIIEIFAVFFGVRISEGIVSAVHALHRHTRTVAAGDLDAVIAVPNEDEFGDLAGSFNEMTRAVKQGREDALARERLTRELETAREIQERLLPHDAPEVAGFEITGTSVPSREVGGDYFDFILQDDRRIGVAIGDVSGKGMPAALLMSNLQASLHGQVLHPSEVGEVVARVNDLIVRSTDPHMFATFFYGVLDPREGGFTSTNAGHNPPLVLRTDGTVDTLRRGGLLLGMEAGVAYEQESVVLAPGEVVVMYTDGITEAVGPGVEEDDPEAMFGEERLVDVVRRHAHLPAVGIKEAILAAVAEHTAGVDQSDDITLVVVRRKD